MTRDELIARTRQLIEEGRRLEGNPSQNALQTWLQLSDELLRSAWGTMDRFHMAWLTVGRPKAVVRGRRMTPDEEAAYVREVVAAKNAVLAGSLDSAARGLPFVGETGGVGPGGLAQPNAGPGDGLAEHDRGTGDDRPARPRPGLDAVADELAAARRRAQEHRDAHQGPRAPRPEKMER